MENVNPKTSTYIPQELKEMILSRLPIKSLKRFVTVDKEWSKIITESRHFLSAHLKFTNSLNDKTLFLVEYGFRFGIFQGNMSHVLYSGDDTGFNKSALLKTPLSMNSLGVYGCCNGLICLSNCTQVLVLWNPSIQRGVKLPVSGVGYRLKFPFGCVFDHVNNDFKVLSINYFLAGRIEVEICRLSTNMWEEWTKERPFIYILDNDNNQVDLQGFAHWIGVDSEQKAMIVSFDVHNEVFGSVAMPPMTLTEEDRTFKGYPLCLFVFEGSLVLIQYSNVNDGNMGNSRTRYDFWKMEEYGKGESWNRWHSLYCYGNRRALGFRKNGEFLWVDDRRKKFISTNLDNFSETCFDSYVKGRVLKCLNYVESLALLNTSPADRWDWRVNSDEGSQSPLLL